MSQKSVKTYDRWIGGISDYPHESLIPSGYAFSRSVDVRSDPAHVTLLPKTIKESGTIITDLVKWIKPIPSSLEAYEYGDSGNFYKRTSAGVHSLLHTVSNSHGNGLSYFGEDNFMYYTSDKLIGRYGPIGSSSISFVDDYFGSQGGVPLNTNSLDLEASSSQSASRADTASLSIVGNITLEAQIKPESLPSSGNTMSVISKWDENGNIRSYKFAIGTSSNFFGDGSDGALTISSDTTEAPIDSACTGTSGAYTLSATNASFAAGQKILIHQTQGTGAGGWMRNTIQSYTAGTITLVSALNMNYATGAQVRVMKQYTDVTIDSGKTYTAKAWDGTVGGILAFYANGTLTVNGTISSIGKGFRGGDKPAVGNNVHGKSGESYTSSGYNVVTTISNYSSPNGGAGRGGGGSSTSGDSGVGSGGGGGAGIQNGSKGSNGQGGPINSSQQLGGYGGTAYMGQDLTASIFLGSGGGSGSNSYNSASDGGRGGYGGGGGGIIALAAPTITLGASGSITSTGQAGEIANLKHASGSGGGGGGGAVLLYCQTSTLGTNQVDASGGEPGYNTNGYAIPGGVGGYGQVHIDYLTSYTGSTYALTWTVPDNSNSPATTSSRTTVSLFYATQDNNLGSSSGYTLLFLISSNGTNTETYTKPANIELDKWQHIAVAWTASSSTAEFFLNGVSLGTQVGALTSISDNGSRFAVGADFNSSAQHFYDGLIDEVRVWNTARTVDDIATGLNQQLGSTLSGLQAMYLFNGAATDSTANANTLTLNNSPSYSSDVPYPSPTTRLDIDQSATTAGNTYTLTTSISEASTDKKLFTPEKDPQKSIAVLVAAKGTGDWTLTVHDQWNNVIATKTIANASVNTGYCEFIFSDVWRPLTNFTNEYHFHLTSTVADGTVTTTDAGELNTVSYRTYYQFLVEDTDFHPIAEFLQFLVIGNERYIATIEATLYEPHQVVLPSGWRIRCFGYWREYIVAGAIKGTDVTDFDSGRLYFWDGYSPTYNFYVDVPEGAINAVLGSKGDLYVSAGYKGQLLLYQGGDSAQQIKQIPKIADERGAYMEIYPQGLSMWDANLRIGVAGGSDSTDLQRGVYTYGHSSIRYPEILTFDYPISTGNYGSSVTIGAIIVIDQKLLISWKDSTGYGVDYVSADNDCYTTGTIEMIIENNNESWKEKRGNVVAAMFEPLDSGHGVDIKYQLNENDTWVNLGAVTDEDAEVARLTISNGVYRYIQAAADLYSTSGTSPKLKSIVLEVDEEKTSRRV